MTTTTTAIGATKRRPTFYAVCNSTEPMADLALGTARCMVAAAVLTHRHLVRAMVARGQSLRATVESERRHVAAVRYRAANRRRLVTTTAKLPTGQRVTLEWAKSGPTSYRATNLAGLAQAAVTYWAHLSTRRWVVAFTAEGVVGRMGLPVEDAGFKTLTEAKSYVMARTVLAIDRRVNAAACAEVSRDSGGHRVRPVRR